MLTKNQVKYIQSLQLKKNRQIHQSFIVEGAKNVLELLHSDFVIETIYLTEVFYKENRNIIDNQKCAFEIVKEAELEKIGHFETNNAALALVKTKENIDCSSTNELVLVLDEIRDPGNLGTIIRIADWYGLKNIVCAENTVDVYNPKVIAATMGSFLRVNLFYTQLNDFLKDKKSCFIGGAVMNGRSIYEIKLPQTGYLIIGNESNGISEKLQTFVNERITIPKRGGAESLNAGVATAILLDNFFRAS
jgi:RNA methyltransferase, TrmH family